MRASWEMLYQRLRRSVSTLRAQQEFDGARRRRVSLAPFPDPAALLDYLGERHEDLEAVDRIYSDLVLEVQAGAGAQQTAMALLWLGLWPGLDAGYHRLQRYFGRDEDGLVDAIIGVFTLQVEKANRATISRLAATLVRNTRRDVRNQRLREIKDIDQRPELPDDDDLPSAETGDDVERRELRARMLAAAGPYRLLLEAILFRGLNVKEAADEMYQTKPQDELHLDLINDVQLLTPTRKGPLGVPNFNIELQRLVQKKLFGRDVAPLPPGRRPSLLPGDKIIMRRNTYSLDLMNGSVGQVISVDAKSRDVTARFDGRTVVLSRSEGHLQDLDLAYALTIHQSQGSEFPVAILVVSKQHWFQLNRSLLYTGATRARRATVIVGDHWAIRSAAARVDASRRRTWLSLSAQKNADGTVQDPASGPHL